VGALVDQGLCPASVVGDPIAAVSVGVVDGQCLLDLDYSEDSRAEVDMNVAMLGGERFLEIQASAEAAPLAPADLTRLLELSGRGITRLIEYQSQAIEGSA
jgi:ribonuclease PH